MDLLGRTSHQSNDKDIRYVDKMKKYNEDYTNYHSVHLQPIFDACPNIVFYEKRDHITQAYKICNTFYCIEVLKKKIKLKTMSEWKNGVGLIIHLQESAKKWSASFSTYICGILFQMCEICTTVEHLYMIP